MMVVMLLIVTAISVSRLSDQNATTQRITSNLYPKAAAAARISLLATDMGRIARTLILQSNKEALSLDKQRYDQDQAEIAVQMDLLDKLVDTDKGRELLNAVKATGAQFFPFISEVAAIGMQDKDKEATMLLFGERYKTQAAYLVSLDTMNKFQAEKMVDGAARASEVYTQATWLVVLTAAAAILLAVGFAYFVTRSVTSPLVLAVSAAERVASGDLSVPIISRSRDEAGQLLEALQRMQQSLSQTVSSVRTNTENVAAASAQIAQGNTDLSQRTEEQAASLEETAASMEQLTATVKQNAENARQGNTLASNASEVAARGGEVVNQVVVTMQDISASSSQVVNIISVIEGIAFQTNILALNAAVEAARAGEQGRGFAVVAGEVRTLAQRSANAAKEIKDLISASVQRVHSGSVLVDEAGRTMQEVVVAVKRVTDLMGEISAASAEQHTGIEQVNQAVMQMDEVTQQNAALVEEASAAAQSMAAQATSLRELVSVFRLDASAPIGEVKDRTLTSARKPPSAKPVAIRVSRTPVAVSGGAPSTADWQSF